MKTNGAVHRVVSRAVYLPVDHAMDGAEYWEWNVRGAMYGTMYQAMYGTMYRAVTVAVDQVAYVGPPHPTLNDFLNEVKRGSL